MSFCGTYRLCCPRRMERVAAGIRHDAPVADGCAARKAGSSLCGTCRLCRPWRMERVAAGSAMMHRWLTAARREKPVHPYAGRVGCAVRGGWSVLRRVSAMMHRWLTAARRGKAGTSFCGTYRLSCFMLWDEGRVFLCGLRSMPFPSRADCVACSETCAFSFSLWGIGFAALDCRDIPAQGASPLDPSSLRVPLRVRRCAAPSHDPGWYAPAGTSAAGGTPWRPPWSAAWRCWYPR